MPSHATPSRAPYQIFGGQAQLLLLKAFDHLKSTHYSDGRVEIPTFTNYIPIWLMRPLRRADVLTYPIDTWYVPHVTH